MNISFTAWPARAIAGLTGAMVATMAQAHEGHGVQGLHGHASDVLGFVLVTLVAAVALWLGRGR
jgi:hypothetical protein